MSVAEYRSTFSWVASKPRVGLFPLFLRPSVHKIETVFACSLCKWCRALCINSREALWSLFSVFWKRTSNCLGFFLLFSGPLWSMNRLMSLIHQEWYWCTTLLDTMMAPLIIKSIHVFVESSPPVPIFSTCLSILSHITSSSAYKELHQAMGLAYKPWSWKPLVHKKLNVYLSALPDKG